MTTDPTNARTPGALSDTLSLILCLSLSLSLVF